MVQGTFIQQDSASVLPVPSVLNTLHHDVYEGATYILLRYVLFLCCFVGKLSNDQWVVVELVLPQVELEGLPFIEYSFHMTRMSLQPAVWILCLGRTGLIGWNPPSKPSI